MAASYSSDESNYEVVRRHRKSAITRANLRDARDDVIDAYRAYGNTGDTVSQLVPITVSNDQARALRTNFTHTYEGKCLYGLRSEVLARSDTWGGRCPFCTSGRVGNDLDHYLPRSVFPEFSVLSINLVPICKRCNELKGADDATKGQACLHAYLDSGPGYAYLVAEITGPPLRLAYRLQLDGSAGAVEGRVQYQFDSLQLAEYWRVEGLCEVTSLREMIRALDVEMDASDLRMMAARQASLSVDDYGLNHWRTAIFRTLSTAPDLIIELVFLC
jgi:5-methylcytosine-specific restriction endonuclease McrA